MSPITPQSTPQELRARAAQEDRAAYESFERCDTDGALSQWGHQVCAQKYRLEADIRQNDGRWEFPALFDLDGTLIAAKYLMTRYGSAFGILASDDPDSEIIRWFNPSQALREDTRRRNDARKGFYVGRVLAPARADLTGATLVSVRAYAKRIDGGFSRDVQVTDNGQSPAR